VCLTPNSQSEAPIRQNLILQESGAGGKPSKKARTAGLAAGELFYSESPPDDGRSKFATMYEREWKYIDASKDEEHLYLVHFPEGCTVDVLKNEKAYWPLLIFFHGKGGGSYFESTTKKTQNEPGLLMTAEKMVVLSPRCKWTWQDDPERWVEDLITSFVGLPGIDRRKVYISGYSMGGRSCWELVARLPQGTFAACAPGGAYHQPEYEEDWINRMADVAEMAMRNGTHVRPYHGKQDERCSFSVQERLWKRVQDKTHWRCYAHMFEAQPLEGDHSSAMELMYFNNTDFCKTLLDLSLEA